MALPNLSKMKDEDYKLLSSRDLAKYNTDLPQMDYEHPYEHQSYPRVVYKLVSMADGTQELDAVDCENEHMHQRLRKDGWKDSPTACGVILHSEAPKLRSDRIKVPVAPKDVTPPELKD